MSVLVSTAGMLVCVAESCHSDRITQRAWWWGRLKAYSTHTPTNMCTLTHTPHTDMHACTHIHTHTPTHIHAHTHTTHMRACTHIPTHTHTHTHMCTLTHKHTHTHTHTPHTHTHTQDDCHLSDKEVIMTHI